MTGNDREITGFDAYDLAWGVMSANLWAVLRFNVIWFVGAVSGLLILIILFESAASIGTRNTLLILYMWFFLIYSAVWEAANIAKFSNSVGQAPEDYSVVKIILARFLFLAVVILGYYFLVLPGIYLHCRLCLYLPLLVHRPRMSIIESFRKSWEVTSSHFLAFYTLWIAIVVSKPVCFLPLGLGFVLERPASGLAKSIMLNAYAEVGQPG
jgi:hypothetical protein